MNTSLSTFLELLASGPPDLVKNLFTTVNQAANSVGVMLCNQLSLFTLALAKLSTCSKKYPGLSTYISKAVTVLPPKPDCTSNMICVKYAPDVELFFNSPV